MTRPEQRAVVVRLACLTEDRTDAEQRALLGVARMVDTEINRAKRARWNRHHGPLAGACDLPDASDLEGLVDATRVLGEGDHPVTLKARKRRPWADGDPGLLAAVEAG